MELQTDISVAICCKSAQNYIGKCISSLLNQTFTDFEIVIVEDPPFDRTREIILAFHEKKIAYIRNEKHLGLSRSRNKSVELSKGKYVFFTDADCTVSKKWIEQGLMSLRKQDCIGVEGRTYYHSEEYLPRYSDAHAYVKNVNGGQYMTCNIVYKRSIIESIGGFDENYVSAEDRDLALRAMKIGKIEFNPEMIVYHQKITRKPAQFSQMCNKVKFSNPRVLLYKKTGDKPFSFWRILNAFDLATLLFPLLILTNLLLSLNSFKTMEDFNLLPYEYVNKVFERLQIWKTCARERVFLI